jgi:hypothetical protein
MPTPGPLFRLIVYGGKGISRVDGHFRWSNMGVTSGLVHCNKVLFFLPACYRGEDLDTRTGFDPALQGDQ